MSERGIYYHSVVGVFTGIGAFAGAWIGGTPGWITGALLGFAAGVLVNEKYESGRSTEGFLLRHRGTLLAAGAGIVCGVVGATWAGSMWGFAGGFVVGLFGGSWLTEQMGWSSEAQAAELEARAAYVAALVSAASAEGTPPPGKLAVIREVTRELFAAQGYGDEADIEAVVDAACRETPGPADAAAIAQSLSPQFRDALAYDVLRILYADRKLSSAQRRWLDQYVEAGGVADAAMLSFFDRGRGRGSRRQWLEELGLDEDAGPDQIKRAYRQKAREFHPDHHQDLPPQIRALAEARMAAITAAYQNLTKHEPEEPGLYWFQPLRGGSPFPGKAGVTFKCGCWLCGRGNRVPAEAEPASARCGRCHALLGMPIEYVQFTGTEPPAAQSSAPLNVIYQLTAHDDLATAASFSPDGGSILTAGFDHLVRLWDVAGGELRCEMPGHTGPIHSAVFSRNGRLVVSASNDRTARLWEVATGRERRRFGPHGDWVHFVDVAPDGQWVLTSSLDGTARIWDAQSGEELCRFTAPDVPESVKRSLAVHAAAFSPDGRQVLSGGLDHTARVWDAASARELVRFEVETHSPETAGNVSSVAFAPDGRHVLIGSTDGVARLCDVTSGREVCRFTGHAQGVAGAIHAVSFGPGGRTVLTASNDGTARIWNTTNGHELAHMGCEAPVACARFAPDGRRIVTAHTDGSVAVWDAVAVDSAPD